MTSNLPKSMVSGAEERCAPNRSPLPDYPVVAMAYVPYQNLNTVYAPEKGFDMGTIFPELDKPFLGGGKR